MHHYLLRSGLQNGTDELPARLLPGRNMTLQDLENLDYRLATLLDIDHFGSVEGLRGDLKQVAMEHRFAALGEVRAAECDR